MRLRCHFMQRTDPQHLPTPRRWPTPSHVIAQPAGERPLRTVVATLVQRQAPQALNEASSHAMHSFLEALHIPGAALALPGEQEEVGKQR